MKKCTKCNLTKKLVNFSKKKSTKDGYQNQCKVCKALYLKEHYRKNKKLYMASANRSKKKLRDKLRKLKHMKPCKDCNVAYPYYVMDFDHRNPSEKLGPVGYMTNISEAALMKEIAKCDLVCSNCHRIRTHAPVSPLPSKQKKG